MKIGLFIFYLILFIIAMTVISIAILGIMPDSMLTELGRNNRDILIGKSKLLNFFILICGGIVGVKALREM